MNVIQSSADQKLGPTKALVKRLTSLTFDEFDGVTLKEAKVHLLDSIGACLAGAPAGSGNDGVGPVRRDGARRYSRTGAETKTDMLTAALLGDGGSRA